MEKVSREGSNLTVMVLGDGKDAFSVLRHGAMAHKSSFALMTSEEVDMGLRLMHYVLSFKC